MIRVYVIVEGQTEESFVSGPLAETLWTHQVMLIPILLGIPGHRGGHTSYTRVQKDILRQLKHDRGSYCTTMIDFYGLGSGFPGTPVPAALPSIRKVERIETAVKNDICGLIPDLRPDVRLIPYLSLHEYEALLFSDPEVLADKVGQARLANLFRRVRSQFTTPEDIDDGQETAPSKRIIDICPSYKKVIEGTSAARAVGIQKMLDECPHFRAWVERLETLNEL